MPIRSLRRLIALYLGEPELVDRAPAVLRATYSPTVGDLPRAYAGVGAKAGENAIYST